MKKYKLKKNMPMFKAGTIMDDVGNPEGIWVNYQEEVSGWDGKILKETHKLLFTKDQLEQFPEILTEWLEEIQEQSKTVLDLKEGDECWEIRGLGLEHRYAQPYRDEFKAAVARGDIFVEYGAGKKELARRKAKVILERDTKGCRPKWDLQTYYYDVSYDYEGKFLWASDSIDLPNHRDLWFATLEDAEESIRNHEKEWLIWLGVEE